MRVITFEREDGSEVLITLYADDAVTMAERPAEGMVPRVWGPPIEGVIQPEYDYLVRRIDDILLQSEAL